MDMRISSEYFKDIYRVDTRICTDIKWIRGYVATEYPRVHLFLGVALKW